MDANGYEIFDLGCHGELFTFSNQYYFENLGRFSGNRLRETESTGFRDGSRTAATSKMWRFVIIASSR